MAATNSNSASAFTQVIGSIPTNKPGSPAIIALYNNTVISLDNTTPGTQWRTSSAVPASVGTPQGITGDSINGVAVYSGNNVAYLTGLGSPQAQWNVLEQPLDSGSIEGISGDLVNGLVVYSGRNLYSLLFNGANLEWNLMTIAPFNITAIAGDPTNGILIAVDPSGNNVGPSSFYIGQGGCLCQWSPLTGQGMPIAKVKVQYLSGNATNNYIFYGEGQLYSLTIKAGAGTQGKLAPLPFQVKDIFGAAANGILAIAGSGDLLVSNADSSASSWTVVALMSSGAKPAATSASNSPIAANAA